MMLQVLDIGFSEAVDRFQPFPVVCHLVPSMTSDMAWRETSPYRQTPARRRADLHFDRRIDGTRQILHLVAKFLRMSYAAGDRPPLGLPPALITHALSG